MLLLLLSHWFICHQAQAQSQSFSVTPSDVDVLEGQSVTLRCQVADQGGNVQWSKDGLLLGFNRSIPGFPRHIVEGDEAQGSHDLSIYNATGEDEGEYECQVSPTEQHPALFSRARLSVLIPATSIEIEGYKNNSKVQVEHSQSLELKCLAKGGKPAAEIRWYRNSIKLRPDVAETQTRSESEGKETAVSTLKLHPLPDDNRAAYTCEVQRLQLQNIKGFKPLRARVKLDVHFPAGRPTISGYREGDKVRAGDMIELKCISRGGNPLSRLTWLKNGEVIDLSYISTDWESQNDFDHEADASDNGAIYTCRAESIATEEPFETSISLTVLYAPATVIVTAPAEAKPGDVITVTCVTTRSNPPSEISWVVDGSPVWSSSIVKKDNKGGWVTKSLITTNITQQERNQKLFSCYAVNQALGETVVGIASVSVLYAPDPPGIFGYTEGFPIRAGTLQRLTCVSSGGNPVPTLKWFKENEEITTVALTSNGNVLSGEIVIILAQNDNGATYRCETLNAAIVAPFQTSIKLTVHFPPLSVSIKVKPRKPKAGHKMSLICESGSSNPPAKISWWGPDAGELFSSVVDGHFPSANGGVTTKSILAINATAEDDGSIYTCKATNDAIQRSIHDALILNVMYSPIFSAASPMIVDVREGESFTVNVTARANPSNITYTWIRNKYVIWEEAYFNMSVVQRSDGGQYVIKASNDIGETALKLFLKVFTPAIIVKETQDGKEVTQYVLAEPESNPQLECTAEGHPLNDDAIQWKRSSFDMAERTKVASTLTVAVDSTRRVSRLTVLNVSEADSGAFECVAYNDVGDSDTYKIILLIKHSPRIVDADKNAIVKSNRGIVADLICRAQGVPAVKFTWSLEGGVISTSDSRADQLETRIDHDIWEGKMSIKDVGIKDFGEYKCIARNDVGFDTSKVVLEANSAPDPPVAVKVVNISHDSLRLTWMPGFDGGHNQTYRIRYKAKSEPNAKYVDVHPLYATATWLTGLESETLYEIAIMSTNNAGHSSYSEDRVKARTKARFRKITSDHPRSKFEEDMQQIIIMTASVLFVFLFMLNIILLSCYYSRKRAKGYKESKDSTDDSSVYDSAASSFPTDETATEYTLTDYGSSFLKHRPYSEFSHTTSESRLSTYSDLESKSVNDISGASHYDEDDIWFDSIGGPNTGRQAHPVGAFV